MGKRYLFFASLSYSYPILRPLQEEIRRRGDDVAWFLEDSCPDLLTADEKRLNTIDEVMQYNPIAIFAPGNYIYDFFPGVKVQVFHGYPINKRNDKVDDHFRLRGWFDIYCTQGESSTIPFKQLEKKHKYFKIYETGWCKTDNITTLKPSGPNRKPTIFVATTFSKGISSLDVLYPTIKSLVEKRDWNWMITMHPKLQDKELRQKYLELSTTFENVTYLPVLNGWEEMNNSDVLLCDSSSIIIEYMLLDKPVVTYQNTNPGKHLIDINSVNDIEGALETALSRPDYLMQNVREYSLYHERYRDGKNSARILDAVDDFIENHQNSMGSKPLNLIRKLKLRKQLGYWKF